MGNRVGVIFHKNWEDFSPLLYSHYGADLMPFQIQEYITNYYTQNNINDNDGHKYEPSHMMVGFIKFLDEDIHIRVENLTELQIDKLRNEHNYPNYFDGGCWIVDVSKGSYGEAVKGDVDWIDMGNILKRIFLKDGDNMPIEDLGLSKNIYKYLKRAGINYIEELENMTDEELQKIRNIGQVSCYEIRDKINKYKL